MLFNFFSENNMRTQQTVSENHIDPSYFQLIVSFKCTSKNMSLMVNYHITFSWCTLHASVQFSCPVVSDSLRLHESQLARPPCPSSTTGVHSLTSIESVMPSSHLILCRPLLLLPPIPPSIRVFSNESTLHMSWPKYWSFSFSIIPS